MQMYLKLTYTKTVQKKNPTTTLQKQAAIQSSCLNSILTQQEFINKSFLEVGWWHISDMRCSDIDPEVEFD